MSERASMLEKYMNAGRLATRLLLCAIILVANGCGDDSATGPSMQSVAGSYEASSFTVTQAGFTTDFLAFGPSLSVTLERNGTTTGALLLRGRATDGSDLVIDVSGTWSLNGTTVRFSHEADTFLRHIPFEVKGETLSGETLYYGQLVHVTFSRN